jgi:hypothetical protein
MAFNLLNNVDFYQKNISLIWSGAKASRNQQSSRLACPSKFQNPKPSFVMMAWFQGARIFKHQPSILFA